MKTTKLTGKVLFGNILKPRSYNSGLNKFEDNPQGDFQLTLIVDENHKDYKKFLVDLNERKAEIMASEKYKKLGSVEFSFKDKPHVDKDKNVIEGKRQVTMKRGGINKNMEDVTIDIYNAQNQPYRPTGEIGYGADVQAIFAIGDTYIASSKKWYLTMYLFAVLIENEATSSYEFDVKEPVLSTGKDVDWIEKQFDGDKVEPVNEEKIPF